MSIAGHTPSRRSTPVIRGLGISLFSLLISSQAWAEPAISLGDRLRAAQGESGFPGFAVAITERGKGVVYEAGFGWADRASQKPFTETTVLNIGSVSKTFIGVALMRAVEQGRVDLDAPIERHLSFQARNPRFPDQPITLRHLATHTSGIQDRETIYRKAYTEGLEPSMALGDYLRRYLDPKGDWFERKNFGKHAPGKAYDYSNIGAALAAYVIEKAMEEPFDSLTTRTVLQPLGMTDSGWSYADINFEQHATLYDGNEVVDPYTLVTYPDGGLRTSASSLGRYLSAILDGGRSGDARILAEASVEAMTAAQFGSDDRPKGLGEKTPGLFWSINGKGQIGHTGGDPGISAVMAFDPDSGCGWLFLTNTELSKKTFESFQGIWELLKAAPVCGP